MSRSFSAGAIQQFFAREADDPLILLVTITAPNDVPGNDVLRFANGWIERLSGLETDATVTAYGVVSRSQNYVFLPMEITLPSEDDAAPRAQITLHDVTREAMPLIRSVTSAPTVKLELVLASDPDTVELAFDGLSMTAISYNRETVTAQLVADNLALEPFPAHTFTPAYFPGLF